MFFHPDVEPGARPGAPNTSVMTATAKLCGIASEVADSRRENRLYPYTSRTNATTASIESLPGWVSHDVDGHSDGQNEDLILALNDLHAVGVAQPEPLSRQGRPVSGHGCRHLSQQIR
jgi:hypothetical protein